LYTAKVVPTVVNNVFTYRFYRLSLLPVTIYLPGASCM
jgi:hypothetical protein